MVAGMSSAGVSSSLVLTNTTPTPLPPLETTGSTPPEVTLADRGRTIVMRVGERFLLNLEGGAAWVVEIADPQVLGPVTAAAAGAAIPAGAQGLFEAAKAGTTRLSAINDPPCRKAKPPCMLPTRSFEVEVIVK